MTPRPGELCTEKQGHQAHQVRYGQPESHDLLQDVILWYVDALLGNDREIYNYTTAITRQQLVNSNIGKVFSVLSVPRCHKQHNLGVRSELAGEFVRGLLRFSRCELLLLEAGS
jgi:hypothetical protein